MLQVNFTIHDEFVHEKRNEPVARIYPVGIHGAVTSHIKNERGLGVNVATPAGRVTALPDALPLCV